MVVQLTCLLAVLPAFLHTLSWSTLASPRMARHAVHAYGLRACWLCYLAALDIQGFVVCSVPCLIAAVRMYHSRACWLWGLQRCIRKLSLSTLCLVWPEKLSLARLIVCSLACWPQMLYTCTATRLPAALPCNSIGPC